MTTRNKRLFVVFINQLDRHVEGVETITEAALSPDIVGRFKSAAHLFIGIDGLEEIQFALRQYDEVEQWPPGSGISFTRHFVADALFTREFRLESYAPLFRQKVASLRAHHNLSANWTWPMKSFEGFVAFLLTHVVNAEGFPELTDAHIDQALERSGYLVLELSRAGRVRGRP